MDLAALAELLPPDLPAQERRALLLRLEVLEAFAEADHQEDRLAAAIGELRAARAARARLGLNPGRPKLRALVPAEARRWQRLERRLRERLAAPPALDAQTRAAAAAWLARVQGGQALSTPASRRYWHEVCAHKIRMAPPGQPPRFWHACLALVESAGPLAPLEERRP